MHVCRSGLGDLKHHNINKKIINNLFYILYLGFILRKSPDIIDELNAFKNKVFDLSHIEHTLQNH